MSRKKRVGELNVEQQTLSRCTCGPERLEDWDASGSVNSVSRKLAALAEVMEGYTSTGTRYKFAGARYDRLEYPEKIRGLGELAMQLAAELAWIADRLE